jgi:hypothetical protein
MENGNRNFRNFSFLNNYFLFLQQVDKSYPLNWAAKDKVEFLNKKKVLLGHSKTSVTSAHQVQKSLIWVLVFYQYKTEGN